MLPFLQRLEKSCVLVRLSLDGAANVGEGEPAQKEVKCEWFENEDVENVIARFTAQLSQAAADLGKPDQLSSSLHIVNPSRSADSLDHEVLLQFVGVLQQYRLREAVFKDNCEYIATAAGTEGLVALTSLDLTACGLTEVPELLSALVNLQTLHLRRNKLTTLPAFLGTLAALQHLDTDDNLITTLPESLQDLTNLHTLSLSNNRLKAPIVNLSKLDSLCVLHLGGNPLQYFPELSQAPSLLTVSLANLLVVAEPSWTSWSVEMLNQRTSRLTMRSNTATTVNDTLKLLLSRSSAQHPLIAGGLAEMAEVEEHRHAMLKAEGLLPQLVHAMMSENIIVAAKSCETLCKLTKTKEVAADVEKAAGVSAAQKLMLSANERLKQCGLAVLNELAFASEDVARRILGQGARSSGSSLLADLMATVQHPEPVVQCSALLALSTLAFPRDNKLKMLQADGCLTLVKSLASKAPDSEACDTTVRMAALRVLAVLGQNDLVDAANGKPQIRGRGLRVLALDGGGMKGMTEVTLLREIEKRTGKRMHELFDVIGGTSTGCMIAVGCGVMGFTLDEMEAVYMDLGTHIFAPSSKDAMSAAAASQEQASTPTSQSWSEGLMKLYRSGEQGMRVAMYGAKHNTPLFEELLQEKTHLQSRGTLNDMSIDATCLSGPKVFRTYEFAPNATEEQRRERLALHIGSSKHKLWEAIRASSAAPYYLDDFSVGDERFIDGAVSVNNPSVVAVQEAKMLYPDLDIDCFVSLGVGIVDFEPRGKSMSTYFETGSAVIEGASGVCRQHEALACMLGMSDCVYERFCPVDARCGMPLDCTEEKQIKSLVQATEEYIEANSARIQRVCDMLMQGCEPSDVDRSTDEVGRLPADKGVLTLAAPVSESCLAGQLVNAVQGMEQSCIVGLKQLKEFPAQDHASLPHTRPGRRSSSTVQDPCAQPETAEVLPASRSTSRDSIEEQHRPGQDGKPGAGHGNLRLIVPGTVLEGQVHSCTERHDSAQLLTPSGTDVKRGYSDSAVLSHPVRSMMAEASMRSPSARNHADQKPQNGHTVGQMSNVEVGVPSSTSASLPPLSTSLIGRNEDVRSSYEETPAVQEMVHGKGGAKGTSGADRDQSPSSGILGMLVSMVSTSISPKRDESSSIRPADSTFQAVSSPGTVDAEELSESSGAEAADEQSGATSGRPVLSPLRITPGRSSPNCSTPFDVQCAPPATAQVAVSFYLSMLRLCDPTDWRGDITCLFLCTHAQHCVMCRTQETPRALAQASHTEAENGRAIESSVTAVPTQQQGQVSVEGRRTRRGPKEVLDKVKGVGFVVVATQFVSEGLVSRYSQSINQVVEGSEAATALQRRLGGVASGPASDLNATACPPSERLAAFREPVQAVDGTGAWFKCLLQHSQSIACPGSDAPIHLSTLLMQEFRPESTWPLQELLELLKRTRPIVVLPHAVPAEVVSLVLSCGSVACLVAKCADTVGNVDCAAEAALCVPQLIEEVRSGSSLSAAMLRSDADKHFDLQLP